MYTLSAGKSTAYWHGMVKKVDVIMRLQYWKEQPLYRDMKVEFERVNRLCIADEDALEDVIDGIDMELDDVHDPYKAAMAMSLGQQTMLMDEDMIIAIVPAENGTPRNIVYNKFAEELTYPQIYLGQPCRINPNIPSSIMTQQRLATCST